MNGHGVEAVCSGHQVRSGPVGRDRGLRGAESVDGVKVR